jgi:2'-5' RNA ligase
VTLRMFIALELSDSLKEGILALIGELRGHGVRASWSRPSTMHLTLRFLGDVDETMAEDVIAAVSAGARAVPGFTVATGSLGAFPSPRRPRVLWMGVEPVEELYELHEGVERELSGIGFPRERRRFHPHITLGRVRDPGAKGLGDLLETLEAPRENVLVRDVRVMKSTLTSAGAEHEELAAVPLLGADRTPTSS